MDDTSMVETQKQAFELHDADGDIDMRSKEGPDSRDQRPITQSTYVPQFSDTASLIIDRINGISESSPGTHISSDIHSIRVVPHSETISPSSSRAKQDEGLSDTLLLPPRGAPATHRTPSTANFPERMSSSSAKRKRGDVSEKADFTQDTIAMPWVDQPKDMSSLPQPNEGPKTCSRCEGNLQKIETQNSTVCLACAMEQEEMGKLRGKGSLQRRDETERLRRKRLAVLPQNIVPAKPELVGFGPGRAPNSSRTEYFATKKKTDLLNVLSLCDQLKPQLLVDILVSVSKKHPDLPIFDSPDWEAQLPSTLRSSKPIVAEKPRHGHVIIPSKAKPRAKATKKILKRTRVIEVMTDAPGVNEDVMPPTWNKAGKGMYSELVPDTEDDALLVDGNDEESFSHFRVDKFGAEMGQPVIQSGNRRTMH